MVYQHKKTGKVYQVISNCALIEKDGLKGDFQVVYVSIDTGDCWIRPYHEFNDRFVKLSSDGFHMPPEIHQPSAKGDSNV